MKKKTIEMDEIEREFRKKLKRINIAIFIIQGLIFSMILFFVVIVLIAVYEEIKR